MFEVVPHPHGGWTVRNTVTGIVESGRRWPQAARDAAILWATTRGAMAAASGKALARKAQASGVAPAPARTWVHR